MPARDRLLLWLRSLRPASLLLAAIAIVDGTALAAWQGSARPGVALLALLTAVLLQALTNLANDYGDMLKGCNSNIRRYEWRGVHTGEISLSGMRMALWLCGGLCVISGCLLIALGCRGAVEVTGFVLLGLLSIAAALAYTLGRHAYGYIGLGDVSVLLFFGWVAVLGSFFLQAGAVEPSLLLPASAAGLFAISVLNVNNLRDIETDPLAGKRTLAVRLGAVRARWYHAAVLALAVVCLALFSASQLDGWARWLFLPACPLLYEQARTILRQHDPAAMAPMLWKTCGTVVLVQVLFVVGVLVSPSAPG